MGLRWVGLRWDIFDVFSMSWESEEGKWYTYCSADDLKRAERWANEDIELYFRINLTWSGSLGKRYENLQSLKILSGSQDQRYDALTYITWDEVWIADDTWHECIKLSNLSGNDYYYDHEVCRRHLNA